MTTAPTGATASGARAPTSRPRALLPWVLMLLALVAVVVVAGPTGEQDRPLDPEGTGPAGTRGLVLLLESFGTDVARTGDLELAGADVAVMLEDVVPEHRVPEVEAWVADGGILVVADPYSRFAPAVVEGTAVLGATEMVPPGRCDVPALSHLGGLAPEGPAARFELEGISTGCFVDPEGGAFVVVTPQGRGAVVSLGSPWVFANDALADADNAGLATALMAPTAGTRLAWLEAGAAGAGESDRDLFDVMPTGVRMAMLQLLVAGFVYAWWRGRRLGPPVHETQPVQLAGSELVSAVGTLLARARNPEGAASILRQDLHRRLCERLGLPPGSDAQVVADAVVERSSLPRDMVLAALAPRPVTDEADLTSFARTVESVRREVFRD